MNALRYLVSSIGIAAYSIASYGITFLPVKSQRCAQFFIDLLEALTALAFGPLLQKLHPPRVDLTGKVAIVTGANSGIGLSIATDLASLGSTVYLACRNERKADAARDQIIKHNPSLKHNIHILSLDTSDLTSVRACATAFKQQRSQLDILIHNAGISSPPTSTPYSPQGHEVVYATNLLGSFLLTYHLESTLSPSARVIFTVSTAQYGAKFSTTFSTTPVLSQREAGFHWAKTLPDVVGHSQPLYANSKGMQCVFTQHLQKRFDEQAHGEANLSQRRIVHSFEPGFTRSAIFDKMPGMTWSKDPFFKGLIATQSILATETDQGAATGLWIATTNNESVVGPGKGGGYWSRMSRRMCKADLVGDEVKRRLWTRWEGDSGVEWR